MKYLHGRFIYEPMVVAVGPVVYRPPVESDSLILQATIGCPWNRCSFCNTYKGINFRPRKIEEFKIDVLIAKKCFGNKPTSVFLADANSIVLKTEKLTEICNYLFKTFSNLEGVRSYGSARFIIKKGEREWREIRESGVGKVYMGLETGDDNYLKLYNKGVTSEDMIKAVKLLKRAGIESSVTIISGICGKGNLEKNADETARVLNRMEPDELRIHNLVLKVNSPLYEQASKGEFVEAPWQEVIKEMRRLIERLNISTRVYTHPSCHINSNFIYGNKLPEEKGYVLKVLDGALSDPEFFLHKVRSL